MIGHTYGFPPESATYSMFGNPLTLFDAVTTIAHLSSWVEQHPLLRAEARGLVRVQSLVMAESADVLQRLFVAGEWRK